MVVIANGKTFFDLTNVDFLAESELDENYTNVLH